MPYSLGLSTSSYLAADGAVGKSGARIRLFQVTQLNDGGGARDIVLRNGTADSDTAWITAATAAASKSSTISFGKEGLVFPSGCFYDKGSATSANFTYRVEL